jgi:hypothetical protein
MSRRARAILKVYVLKTTLAAEVTAAPVMVGFGAARRSQINFFVSAGVKVATDWSRDSRYIVFYEVNPKTNRDLWILPMFGDRKPVPFLQTDANEVDGMLSPDESGRHM